MVGRIWDRVSAWGHEGGRVDEDSVGRHQVAGAGHRLPVGVAEGRGLCFEGPRPGLARIEQVVVVDITLIRRAREDRGTEEGGIGDLNGTAGHHRRAGVGGDERERDGGPCRYHRQVVVDGVVEIQPVQQLVEAEPGVGVAVVRWVGVVGARHHNRADVLIGVALGRTDGRVVLAARDNEGLAGQPLEVADGSGGGVGPGLSG